MISHHHKCIFVHVPKAAGESVERAFIDDLGMAGESWRQLLLGANPYPSNGAPYLSHLTASDFVKLQYIPQQMYDDYFSFAVIRNPWARVVSTYRYLPIHTPFQYFVQHLLPQELWTRLYYFVRPQTEFVCDDDGNVIVDRVVRFENLLPEFYEVCDRVGLAHELPHVNDSADREGYRYLKVRAGQVALALRGGNLRLASHAIRQKDRFEHYTEYYDAETRQIVADLYRSDIEAFDYPFE